MGSAPLPVVESLVRDAASSGRGIDRDFGNRGVVDRPASRVRTDERVDRAAPCERAQDQELGRGRSGVVYRSRSDAGHDIARKVFGASGLTKFVQCLFLGSPNPYAWCEAAVRTAVLRRRILSTLTEFWFDRKLRVARAYSHRWNAQHSSYEMDCELVKGRHTALHHAYTTRGSSELQDLFYGVMKPLQAHLVEAGLDGLAWQAGLGNPVALNNFMCDGPDVDGGQRWAWIDLESGVPALIPINPLTLLSFYLPKCIHHGRALFDDIDVEKLHGYVDQRRPALATKLGDKRLQDLAVDLDALQRSQRQWKSMARHKRSIAYRRATGAIDQDTANWYAERAFRWYCSDSGRVARSVMSGVAAGARSVGAAIKRFDLGSVFRGCWSAIRSQRYREDLARQYVAARITRWQARGQLGDTHAEMLRDDLRADRGSSYLADFGAHLAMKPFIKTVELWILPVLWMMGVIGGPFLGIALIAIGPAARTLYTLYRLVQSALAGREKPWTALVAGGVPVLGNLAYPLQIISSGSAKRGAVARFILHDTFSRLGQLFPIWGGPDTLTEHLFNRCPDLVNRFRRPTT